MAHRTRYRSPTAAIEHVLSGIEGGLRCRQIESEIRKQFARVPSNIHRGVQNALNELIESGIIYKPTYETFCLSDEMDSNDNELKQELEDNISINNINNINDNFETSSIAPSYT